MSEIYKRNFKDAFFGKQVNPHTPVAQKVANEVVYDVSMVKESSFFLNRTSLTPPQIFDAHLLEK